MKPDLNNLFLRKKNNPCTDAEATRFAQLVAAILIIAKIR
jgi:hypothetical protein